MALLHILSPASPLQVSRSRGVVVVNGSVKRSTIPRGKSGINSCTNIFGASNKSDVLQDNRLKNDHPLSVPFLILYAVEFR